MKRQVLFLLLVIVAGCQTDFENSSTKEDLVLMITNSSEFQDLKNSMQQQANNLNAKISSLSKEHRVELANTVLEHNQSKSENSRLRMIESLGGLVEIQNFSRLNSKILL
jgi:uncharacterized protein YlxW (UPF0749 family)